MEIVHNFNIDTNQQTVYNALATQAGINGWWAKDCKIAETVGGTSTMAFLKEGQKVSMGFRVEKLEPNKIEWTCVSNDNPVWIGTSFEFNFKASENGVDFHFVHGNWPKGDGEAPNLDMVRQGWDHFMGSFKTYCEGGEGQPW